MKIIYQNKRVLSLFIFLIISGLTFAQNEEPITIPLSNPSESGKLVVHVIYGSISVTTHNGNDVIVTANGESNKDEWNKHNNRKHKKKRNHDGLKRVINNSLEYSIEEINNTVYIKYRPGNVIINFEVQVPENFSVDLKTVNSGNIYVEGVNGAHEVSNTNGKITMKDISGSVIADALNKDIVVSFKTVQTDATMMFSSLNGNVDITFPNNLKANIIAQSDYGDVYTDFELEKTKNTIKASKESGVYKINRKKGVSGLINGGGSDITFKTLNGDILIRSN
jgi:DUF4097 and DUF4098 domain-containing protein YvlB